jgi:hypothetical protein
MPGQDGRGIAAVCRRGAKNFDGGSSLITILRREQRYAETQQISSLNLSQFVAAQKPAK